MLRVLVVDDELPALEELAYLLRNDSRVGHVRTANNAADALKALDAEPVDALFLDIKMPGLDGLDLAKVLNRFKAPPRIVFVTAYDDYAVDAFELQAVDYVLKPVRAERLGEAVRRVSDALVAAPPQPQPEAAQPPDDETIPVELGGVTRFVNRSDVRYVEAHGDYARLHTAEGSHLVRVPLTALEESWREAGFVRIHRSHLVSVRHVDEVRFEPGRACVRLGTEELAVSRRHTRELRDLLVRRARPGAPR
jgi:DNA-binding LytR/AlgR family response regulator